ncbi:MAG: His/Gly/Thr/Pro-type tRNA ligase C-terminal domain-containing protein, partial [Myxococcota bacterium]
TLFRSDPGEQVNLLQNPPGAPVDQMAELKDPAPGMLKTLRGLRAELDDRSETLGFKIRAAEQQKIPLSLVLGQKEQEAGTVAPRVRRSKEQVEAIPMDAIVSRLAVSAAERKMRPLS